MSHSDHSRDRDNEVAQDAAQLTAVCENPAETMRKAMEALGATETIRSPYEWDFLKQHVVAVPRGRTVTDLTEGLRTAAQFMKPARRKGTARLADLQSLIDWAHRFKGSEMVLYAKPDMSAPTLTCIADYHASGALVVGDPKGDPTARHCHHRAVYDFPLSKEWKAWMDISGQPLDKDELGEFIEAQAKDIMDPTPAILTGRESEKHQPWENRLIQTARQIEGRYGQLIQLLAMSRQFQVYEMSNLAVTTNRDTGEAQIQFLSEHKDAQGQPLQVPNLIIIAIPVFLNGALYRMPVRFRYRKSGSSVKFVLSVYNPEKAFEAAFGEAVDLAREATELPVFKGSPEN